VWLNIVTLLGALCVLAAIAGLAGWWWSLLVLGVLLLTASYRNWSAPAVAPAVVSLRAVADEAAA
jgi:hypothetical protein